MKVKKRLLLFLSFLLSYSSFSQTLYVPNGTNGITNSPNLNIGIGTNWPDKKFTVFGNVRLGSEGLGGAFQRNGILIQSNGTRTELRWQHFSQNKNPYIAVDPAVDATRLLFGTNGSDQMAIRANGNVGIGTINPSQDLEIYGSRPIISLKNSTDGISSYGWLEFNDVNSRMGFVGFGSTSTNHLYIMNEAGGDISVPKGNVGIGTTNTGSWKLAVNGKIRAKEIKVETGWSDFVFFDDYQLPTLHEVENHIKEKGHLKDIPSAKEVEKNGILLGEMDSKLLQKIEELTLYTIQQEKQLDKQSKEILELKMLVQKLLESKK
ncbi:hypothetical protein D1816_12855 [Aquimarina sp. AD10]|uniref:hypothetical protein n=1 Tax=Aquimarina sp. AD10 TaxID=1714849 RepID=UPI000E51A5AD|nr:hypothetical protein [Aquimarina sp. AD10]AXT61198.1 hypothetical protein D1816_12855 [Aquimarina sp. AD10]RKN02186.1 hypothetical protein D7033_01755 [Aquimarina sp. AD10]